MILAALIICSVIYPIAATWSRTDGFSAGRTLNGLAFLEQYRPYEAEAVAWLNSNIGGTPVIVEAAGNDYTEYGRVSQYTGLPTILGWEQHQWVWRGSGDYTLGRREDVDQIYLSGDMNQIETILSKYDAVYVYVGGLERQKYGDEAGAGFSLFMDVAFENEGVTIYRVR